MRTAGSPHPAPSAPRAPPPAPRAPPSCPSPRARSARIAFSRVCRSARISSVLMVSRSAAGSTRPSTCTTSESSKPRTTWAIASASRMLARNWLPSPSLRSALHDAGDVDERHRCGHDALAGEQVGEHLQPRIRQVHDTDVRLDGRERIVGGEHLVAGERIEQGRLADVGETDDADGERHGPQAYVAGRAWRSPPPYMEVVS